MINSILPLILNLIDFTRVIRHFKIKYFQKQKEKCLLTQLEANLLMEYPVHFIEVGYSNILQNLFVTFFLIPLLPIGYVF